ncbi:putative trans-sialidase, Group V [Trypanosoma cruzi]|nr:putative trans-sialidase, Group V [Trypanosoma cruzi]
MLSRVAAVKAPRTHNRRRVTGSSGRRGEGGESEPQRPNMSRRVFTSAVLLLLVVMMCGSGAAHAENSASGADPKFEWKDANGDVTVDSLGVPGLLKVGSGVFAVAEAQCKKGQDSFAGIASQLVTTAKANEPEEVVKDVKDTQFLKEVTSTREKEVDVSRPTTVVKENDIYMLVGNYSRTAATNPQETGADDWGLLLVKGKVSGEGGNRKIQWNENQRLVRTFSEGNHEHLTRLIGGGGSGIQTEDGTLVLPVEATKKNLGQSEVVGGKTVSLLMYSSDASDWKLSKGMSADGCSDPSVVEREKGILMMMTACDDGRRRVYEFGGKEDSWTEALGTLSRVWSNPKGTNVKAVGSGFVTATVGDDNKRRVMLVTLPVPSTERENEENGKGELHLWLTDNAHIVDIGPVSGEAEDVAASSLLYKNAGSGDKKEEEKEELIALYEKKKDGVGKSHSLWSVLLTAQLRRVKEVLATWKEVDERVSKLCLFPIVKGSPSAVAQCSTAMPTDGLVGFLSGNFSENTWRDEYLAVNATVKSGVGAAGTTDGVKFTGRGAGAEWPVGKQGENQLYHFANYNFTLVATVSIDGEPKKGPVPLMGVRAGSEVGSKLMELSYDSGNRWQALCDGEKTAEHSSTWDSEGTTHQVAIVLQKGSQSSVYVDGRCVCVGDARRGVQNEALEEISHFYIGGDGGNAGNQEEVHVTVSNVLLYNRPLTFSDTCVEEDTVIDSTSEGLQPTEAASPSVGEDKTATPLAKKTPEAPVVQSASQPFRKEREKQQHTAVGESATTQQVPAAPSQGIVGSAAALNSHAAGGATSGGGANGDGDTVCESGLLPLLLLLGLWGFAAA